MNWSKNDICRRKKSIQETCHTFRTQRHSVIYSSMMIYLYFCRFVYCSGQLSQWLTIFLYDLTDHLHSVLMRTKWQIGFKRPISPYLHLIRPKSFVPFSTWILRISNRRLDRCQYTIYRDLLISIAAVSRVLLFILSQHILLLL